MARSIIKSQRKPHLFKAKQISLRYEKLLAAITMASGPEKLLTKMLNYIKKTFGYERYLVFFHDRDKSLMWVLGCRGFAKEDAKQISYPKKAIKHAITPRVVRSGRYYFTPQAERDNNIDPYWQAKLLLQGPLLAIPLKVGKTICGVLVINDKNLTEKDVAELKPFVNDLAIAVTMIEWVNRLSARKKIIELMKKIQSSFVQAQCNETAFLNRIAKGIAEILNAQLCAIYRPLKKQFDDESDGNKFERRGMFGYPTTARKNIRSPQKGRKRGLTNHVLAGQMLKVRNVMNDSRWGATEAVELREAVDSDIRAFLGVPMVDSLKSVIGAITLTRARVSASDGLIFHKEDIEIVKAISTAVVTLLEIIDARAELEQKDKQTMLLVHNMAHQVSRPILGLKQSANRLSKEFSEENRANFRACLTDMERGCRNFDIYQKLTVLGGKGAFDKCESIDIMKLVSEVHDRIKPYLKIEERKLVIHRGSGAIRPVIDNREAILECLVNVIDNAIKYSTSKRPIEVEVSQMQSYRVDIRVTNYGIELPKADWERIFDEAFRAETAKQVEITGSGLGLYLSRRLVEIHNGTIKVESCEQSQPIQSESPCWKTTFLISLKC